MTRLIIVPEEDLDRKLSSLLTDVSELIKSISSKNNGEKLYTINQVAKLTGKSHTGIRSLIDRGIIKCNKANLIPETELRAFLAAK